MILLQVRSFLGMISMVVNLAGEGFDGCGIEFLGFELIQRGTPTGLLSVNINQAGPWHVKLDLDKRVIIDDNQLSLTPKQSNYLKLKISQVARFIDYKLLDVRP